MPKNIILKNQNNSFTKKFISPKNAEMAKMVKKGCFFLALEGQILTHFHHFSQITSKYAQKNHIENLEKLIH